MHVNNNNEKVSSKSVLPFSYQKFTKRRPVPLHVRQKIEIMLALAAIVYKT